MGMIKYDPDYDPNVNRCVCCGAVIPEGRMVCPKCEREANETES